jgi:hypothetical protein
MTARVEPAGRIEDHPHRIGPFDQPDRQTGIVQADSVAADDDRVDQRPHPMQASNVCRAGDVMGMSRVGGDAAVEALPPLRDDEIGVALERQIQVEEVACGSGGWRRNTPGP